jgi:hypothetical protein
MLMCSVSVIVLILLLLSYFLFQESRHHRSERRAAGSGTELEHVDPRLWLGGDPTLQAQRHHRSSPAAPRRY